MSNSFGKRLRKLRLAKNMTQSELGKVVNVTNVGVAKWESDDRFPDKDTLIKLADFFDVSLDYLLGRTDYPKATVHKTEVDGHDVEIGYDKEVYPDGLTHEQVIEILKSLKAAGFSFSPKEDSEKDS